MKCSTRQQTQHHRYKPEETQPAFDNIILHNCQHLYTKRKLPSSKVKMETGSKLTLSVNHTLSNKMFLNKCTRQWLDSFKFITNRWAWELVSRKVSGSCTCMRHSREVSIATMWARTSPASSHQPAPSHWRNFSGNT